jgi:hypothetical protein
VEAARNAQMIQQKMAGINVLKQVPPQMIPGYEISIAPLIAEFVEATYGPRMAPRVLKDIRKQLTLDPQFENGILESGMPLPVHPMDNDQEHLQAHMQAFQEHGDLSGVLREHMMRHTMSMQIKQQAMQQQQAQMLQPHQPQQPGGGGPRAGGTATGPRPNGQQMPGAIHADQMRNAMPRARGG